MTYDIYSLLWHEERERKRINCGYGGLICRTRHFHNYHITSLYNNQYIFTIDNLFNVTIIHIHDSQVNLLMHKL